MELEEFGRGCDWKKWIAFAQISLGFILIVLEIASKFLLIFYARFTDMNVQHVSGRLIAWLVCSQRQISQSINRSICFILIHRVMLDGIFCRRFGAKSVVSHLLPGNLDRHDFSGHRCGQSGLLPTGQTSREEFFRNGHDAGGDGSVPQQGIPHSLSDMQRTLANTVRRDDRHAGHRHRRPAAGDAQSNGQRHCDDDCDAGRVHSRRAQLDCRFCLSGAARAMSWAGKEFRKRGACCFHSAYDLWKSGLMFLDWSFDWLIDCLIPWFLDWLIDWSIDWLIGDASFLLFYYRFLLHFLISFIFRFTLLIGLLFPFIKTGFHMELCSSLLSWEKCSTIIEAFNSWYLAIIKNKWMA